MVKVEVLNNLDKSKMLELAKKYGKSAVQQKAEQIYTLSQERCPVDTGTLKASGYIRETDDGYEVGYDCDYMQYVDKMPQSSLSRTGHGGKAHFFSGTVIECMEGSGINGKYN